MRLSIIKREYHTYVPISRNFDYNDEIIIPIQGDFTFLNLSESYIAVSGSFQRDLTKCKFSNNAFAFLFREVRYEMTGNLVGESKDLGMMTHMSMLGTMKKCDENQLRPMGYNLSHDLSPNIDENNKTFHAILPLRNLF